MRRARNRSCSRITATRFAIVTFGSSFPPADWVPSDGGKTCPPSSRRLPCAIRANVLTRTTMVQKREEIMRRLAIAVAAMGIMLGAARAQAQGYGMAGCGLGSLVFKNDGMVQILAATTNGTFGNQTFGITSGTSNCASGGVIKAQREQAAFAEVNFQDLKRNMATGGGEFLASFATLLGCEDSAKPLLAKMTQAKYETLLPSDKTTPMQLVGGVKAQIKVDTRLVNACSDERAVARAEGKLVPSAVVKAPAAVTPSVSLAAAPAA